MDVTARLIAYTMVAGFSVVVSYAFMGLWNLGVAPFGVQEITFCQSWALVTLAWLYREFARRTR
jgi:hypothetical protein